MHIAGAPSRRFVLVLHLELSNHYHEMSGRAAHGVSLFGVYSVAPWSSGAETQRSYLEGAYSACYGGRCSKCWQVSFN